MTKKQLYLFSCLYLIILAYLRPMRDILHFPYALEDAAFIAALRAETEPDPPFAAGVAAQRIVETAYESARLRMPVEVKI